MADSLGLEGHEINIEMQFRTGKYMGYIMENSYFQNSKSINSVLIVLLLCNATVNSCSHAGTIISGFCYFGLIKQ